MKALLQQALEVLESLFSGESDTLRPLKIQNAILALRTAIKQAEQAQPVAWSVYIPSEQNGYVVDDENDAQLVDDMTNHDDAVLTPLYTHPQPPKPLSEERILNMARGTHLQDQLWLTAADEISAVVEFARAVEAESAAEIADLRSQLEDARKDAERLDWMEANPESPSVPYFDATSRWLIPFLSDGAGGFGGGVGYRSYTTLRAAIDAAMKDAK